MLTELELSYDVLLLTPFTLTAAGVEGVWSCGRCGEQHRARTSYAARLRRRSDGSGLTAVVCPDCAEQLLPLALALAEAERFATA